MNSMNSLPTLPSVFFHGSAVAFRRIDVTKGRGRKDDAKRMLLRVLDVDKLGVQLYIGSQSVADRLVKKMEIVDWREYV